jgi:hypothetical protein
MDDEEEEKKPRLFFPKLKLDLSGWRWFDGLVSVVTKTSSAAVGSIYTYDTTLANILDGV